MTTRTRFGLAGILFVVCVLGAWVAGAQAPDDTLERGFQSPPQEARPRVWWHWMNGNITKEGIKADLEWMKRIGIGGVQNFDASLMTPAVVEKRLVFMTPEWKDAFRSAVSLADQLGLEFAIAGSPGWSESGGPWVAPARAMKKLVWTETQVEGGRPFTGALPGPPSNAGPFRNAPRPGGFLAAAPKTPPFYADAAVVAFRTLAGEFPMAQMKPFVSIRGARVDAAALWDGDLTTAVDVPAGPSGQVGALDIDLGEPRVIRGFTLAQGGGGGLMAAFMSTTDDGPELRASDDGQLFRPVVRMPRGRLPQYTASFTPVQARYFRLSFPAPSGPSGPEAELGNLIPGLRLKPPTSYPVTELALYTAPRVHRFEDKAGFAPTPGLGALGTPAVAPADATPSDGVIDLTARMRPDGTLDWTPPPGRWTVLRMGYSLTGATNSPASPEATGLEVDKLSAAAVKEYFTKYLDLYRDASGGLIGNRGLRFIVTDSWEAGTQNWTDDMIGEFARRRGYDLRPWLPALAGHIVGSAAASDAFLWDFRATIAELTVANHYDQLTALLRARGMKRYSEAHEDRRAFITDGMEVKRTAGVPMSAMWTGRGGPLGVPPQFAADVRESASVAHIYGQNVVAAESLTAAGGAYSYSPETLKATADAELSQGVNRFVIHTSVHQPLSDRKPGLGLGPFGQWFTRHETWAEQAGPWVTYLARSSYLLQQGRFVADVLYYYGDDSNITALFGEKGPDIPAGYDFDYANSDVILNRLTVSNGSLTTATGMRYRVLALDRNAERMTVPVLRKLRDLVNAGAVVVGPKPAGSPRMVDDELEVQHIADALWGPTPGVRPVGAGRIYAGMSVAEALAGEKVPADFEHSKPHADTALLFVHRALPGGHLYWVNNRQKQAESVEATFRVTGKAPELWHPDTGIIEPAAYRVEGGRTIVPIALEPEDAVFVVFRKNATAKTRTIPARAEAVVTTVEGPWSIAFQPDRGAPASSTFPALTSWSEHKDAGIKYFSGSATYSKSIEVPADWFAGHAELWLSLGDVKNIAEVSVNGKRLATLWKAPFRVNVTGALRPGANSLQVTVTNLWVNRIVGDQQPGVTKKYTYTVMPFYRADSPLLPSGLLGPVRVIRSTDR